MAKPKSLTPKELVKAMQLGQLRMQNEKLRAAMRKLMARCDDLESAIAGVTDQFETEVSRMSAAVTSAEKILKGE